MAQRGEVPEKEIREAIAALPDVKACKIEFASDGTISAIHIVSNTKRLAKQIVRDIESVLFAEFDMRVDHRKISVARREPEPERKLARGGRPRFVSMKLSTSGGRGGCEVVLERDDIAVTGEVTGIAVGMGRLRLIAMATLRAVEKIVEGDVEFDLLDIVRLRLGETEALTVLATYVSGAEVKKLAGCVQFVDDEQQAAVLATLDACNRIIESSPQAELTEYEVTPYDET